MRTAPEASAASTNAIVSGSTSWSAEVNPNDCAASRDDPVLECHVRSREHRQERQHCAQADDLREHADEHQDQQHRELTLATLAQVMPQAYQQKAE